MNQIYEQLSDCEYKKTINIDNYNQFIKIIRDNWKKIWDFYSQNRMQKLELDTYINKKKAIHKIVRKVIPKKRKKHRFNEYKSKHINERTTDELEEKPILIAFGKGNGSITINNLKNSGPKGPIKTLAYELSKVGLVCLTDEYNSSQICPIHKDHKVQHTKRKFKRIRKIKQKNESKMKEIIFEEKKDYRLCFCEIKNICSQSSVISEEKPSVVIEEKEDTHKLWFNRDFIGGLNLTTILRLTLTGNHLGKYKRNLNREESKSWSLNPIKIDQDNNNPTINITCWSLDQPDNEKVISKKVSEPPKIRRQKKQILVKGKRKTKKGNGGSDDTSVIKVKTNNNTKKQNNKS
jgi:hypothetical protein